MKKTIVQAIFEPRFLELIRQRYAKTKTLATTGRGFDFYMKDYPHEGLYDVTISECGKWQVGVFPVMFGFRIRAGQVNKDKERDGRIFNLRSSN